MELVIEHQETSPSVVHLTLTPDEALTELADGLALGANAGEDAAIWLHGSTAERAEMLAATGRTSKRTLLQMRLPLPADASGIETRAFTPDDIDEFVAVNNRAFSWHPEQSGLTREKVEADMAAAWFDPDGFRLHHIDGELAGFCWTKVHAATDDDPALGEIYVIAVDPPFHGRGLGKAMSLAGLEWLATAGLDTGMLYVESDNAAAVATYKRIGFSTHREDTLWRHSWE